MRDLLHRCDSVRRRSYPFADSSYALGVLPVIPSAVRSQLRCMGRLHPAGIFACVDAAARSFGKGSRLTNGPNNKSLEAKEVAAFHSEAKRQ